MSANFNVPADLNILTGIPVFTLQRLFQMVGYSVCGDVVENLINNETVTCADVGFGKLSILIEDGEVKYKFTPSHDFESHLIEAIKTKKSPIEGKLETSISSKIKRTYKDLF